MVGGLVQQQQIGLAYGGARNEDEPAPPAAELRQRPVELHIAEAECGQGRLHLVGVDSAIRGCNALGDRGPRREGVEACGQDLIDVSDRQSPTQSDATVIDLLPTRQYAQQCRFAATVGANQPDSVALANGKTEPAEDRSRAISKTQVFD